MMRCLWLGLVLGMCQFLNVASWAEPATFEDVMVQAATPADVVLAYGAHPEQFAELRLPGGIGPHPVVVLIHGGCWMADYDIAHIRPLADAISALGYATWSLEYRRPDGQGDPWPSTFTDAALGLDELRMVAEENDLELDQLTVLGHSAGGQLALWLAARPGFGPDHPLHMPEPLPVARVLALAPITDLGAFAEVEQGCNAGARRVVGGAPQQWPDRFRAVSPIDNLPLQTRVELIHASADRIVPMAQSQGFAARFEQAGGRVYLHAVPEPAGHFDLILSYGAGWRVLEDLLRIRP